MIVQRRFAEKSGRPLTGPVVLCDHCGEPILRAIEGNVQWRPIEAEPQLAQIYFTHKHCYHAFVGDRGGGAWNATELSAWLVYLMNSLELDLASAQELAEDLHDL